MSLQLAVVIDTPSNSAKTLAQALGVKRVRSARVNATTRRRLFINWGNRFALNSRTYNRVLNEPANVEVAANKIKAFQTLRDVSGVRLPTWTVSFTEATRWSFEGRILSRATATGSGGVGISVVEKGEPVPAGQFYVKYIRKAAEYRFHVVRDRVIFKQQKRRRNGFEGTQEQRLIRNHANGWVFTENNLTYATPRTENELEVMAITAIRRLGLDFGAVDLIVEQGTNNVFFIEANTRPGIESTRLTEQYANAFKRIAEQG